VKSNAFPSKPTCRRRDDCMVRIHPIGVTDPKYR
jgi:hypothetical protein